MFQLIYRTRQMKIILFFILEKMFSLLHLNLFQCSYFLFKFSSVSSSSSISLIMYQFVLLDLSLFSCWVPSTVISLGFGSGRWHVICVSSPVVNTKCFLVSQEYRNRQRASLLLRHLEKVSLVSYFPCTLSDLGKKDFNHFCHFFLDFLRGGVTWKSHVRPISTLSTRTHGSVKVKIQLFTVFTLEDP